MRRCIAWVGLTWIVLALTAGAPDASAKDEADVRRRDWDVYRRDVRTIDRAVDYLASEVKSREARSVLIAFDQISFGPPPGHNEWTEAHEYASDLDAWMQGIAAWAERTELTIHAMGTLGPAPLRVGAPGWKDSLQKALAHPWYADPRFQGFEPALKWIGRWTPRDAGVVVLIAGEIGPERWAEAGRLGMHHGDESWRRHLQPPGAYWDEEAIGKLLERAGAPLLVVAPEVHFGDELVLPSLPDLPWASRPQRPPSFRLDRPEPDESTAPDPLPAPDPPRTPGPSWDTLRSELEALLARYFPDPVQRRRIIERILAEEPIAAPPGPPALPPPAAPAEDGPGDGDPGSPPPPASGGTTPPPPPGETTIISGRRFRSDTALWFPRYDGTTLVNNHAPSAFGYWPYAYAASRSGGRYLSYPFPPTEWLDACPRDALHLQRLAPLLVSRSQVMRARADDPATRALTQAEALVLRDTPWTDSTRGALAQGWDAIGPRPSRLTRGFRLRRKPYDTPQVATAREFKRRGEQLAELTLEYDAAIKILDRALDRVASGRDEKSHPRSVADLRLGRFWFAMSAFHLEALGIYMREFERFAPPGLDPENDLLTVTYLRAIRLSDCLDAYDDRVLAAEDEKRYGRYELVAWHRLGALAWPDGQAVSGQQGNILLIPEDDPNYRAKRPLSAVLSRLDRRLMPRALDMIRAAEDVMQHHGKTPWGWTTYYSEAYTFVYYPVSSAVWGSRRTGDDVDPGPVTPSSRGGGSTPSGPVTPR